MVGLLQISVPSYALRLVRLCGTRRVGWFLVSAFSSLALLYLVMALKPAGASSASAFNIDLLAAVASVLLLIGMGHLETLFSYRRQARLHARKQHRVWELRTRERTEEPARSNHDSLLETARREHCENALVDCERRYRLLQELSEARHGEAVRHLAGHLASQFNNALTIINSHTRLLLDMPQDSTSAGHLRQLSVTAGRAARLARQLLVVGGRYTLQREWLDLNGVLAELRPTIGTLVAGRVIRESNYGFDLPPIRADARLVNHIIISLVANACDAMPRGGVLRIRTAVVGAGAACPPSKRQARVGEFVCLAISDTGSGMAAQVPSHPLPPYFGGMDAGGGKGLGLASVHEAARQLSGWVEVAAEARGGNEVKVFFPCAGRSVKKDRLPPR
jgi:two-component system cell cycle sensor histidine kinase/response regulator CckA